MKKNLEIRQVTNPFIIRLFARGGLLTDADGIMEVQSLLHNALAEVTRNESGWHQAVARINAILIRSRLQARIYPAGRIPFFQYPVGVVFRTTGEYCVVFELDNLDNGRLELPMPVEANMSHVFFMDLLKDIIRKNQDMANNGLPYEIMARLCKIEGLRHYGVTLRQPAELMGEDLLVISEAPFGLELRYPLKKFQDHAIRYNVQCVIDRETKKEVKTIPEVFFIWELLQDIARAWPENKSAADLVRLVEKSLGALYLRGVTRRRWRPDKTLTSDHVPISWMVDRAEVIRDVAESPPGIVSLPLLGEKPPSAKLRGETSADENAHDIRFMVSFKGLTEDAARRIETIYEKDSLPASLKTLFPLKKKNHDAEKAPVSRQVTFQKAPRDLFRAILKAVQRHLSISCVDLCHSIKTEMRRFNLTQIFSQDLVCVEVEKSGPVVYVSETLSNRIYKFIIERRTDENTESYGVIQVDDEDDEIRRFSISKSRMPLA